MTETENIDKEELKRGRDRLDEYSERIRSSPQERAVLQELADGPLSHEQLCDRLGVHWDELQSLIRSLRTKNEVRIALDRRYQCTDSQPEGP